MFVLIETWSDSPKTPESMAQMLDIIRLPDFFAFSHVDQNFTPANFSPTKIRTLWKTQAAAETWKTTMQGKIASNPEIFNFETATYEIVALEESEYTLDDFVAESEMIKFKQFALETANKAGVA